MRLALTGCSWYYDNGFVFKQLCSAPQKDIEHLTPEMQTEQAEKSRRT